MGDCGATLWLLASPFSNLGIKVQKLDFVNSVKRFEMIWIGKEQE
jgi:hypothetical protein